MKFKDWFVTLSEDIIEDSVFKCIGYCEKWFFYVDKDCPTKKLIEDIEKGWGPANFVIVYIEDIHDNTDDNKLWFVLFCNDGKDGLTNEQIKEIQKKQSEEFLSKIREYEKKHSNKMESKNG